MLYVTSWNMQGGFQDKISRMCIPTSSYILSTNILMVQEAGNPDGNGVNKGDRIRIFGRDFECVASETDPNAKVNYRCTTSILVDTDTKRRVDGIEIIGIAGYRSAIGLRFKDKRIYTIHDTADGSCGDLKNLIRSEKFHFYEPWMIIGDLNCTPQHMTGYEDYCPCKPVPINIGSHDRPNYFYEMYPRRHTQGPGGSRVTTLDYILASGAMIPFLSNSDVVHIENEKALDRHNIYLSDHNMISCAVYI